MRQMALDLSLPQSLSSDDYVVSEANLEAYRAVTSPWNGSMLALTGPRGSGKSHLASVWAELSGARYLAARELDMVNVKKSLVTGALVLEDAGENTPATPFFHLLNMVKEEGALLLLTAETPPASWQISPADLASRLRLMPVVTLKTPDDTLLKAVYMKLFADHQLDVDLGVVDYLLHRGERSIASAASLVNLIDRLALEQGRRVTKPLAGTALERLAA
jgi:chromosomal replication initiation ATPase DnaA